MIRSRGAQTAEGAKEAVGAGAHNNAQGGRHGACLNRLVAVAGDRAQDGGRALLAKLLHKGLARQRRHLAHAPIMAVIGMVTGCNQGTVEKTLCSTSTWNSSCVVTLLQAVASQKNMPLMLYAT